MAEATLLLEYRLDERIELSRPAPYRHVERWDVSVLLDSSSSGDGRVEIGDAHVIVFNLEPGQDIGDLADPASGTWVDADDHAGGRDPGPSTHVLVLDRVWLREEHRGHGLGPIIAAAVIDRLGRGCHLAACFPAPFEAPGTDDERDHSIDALGRLWAKAGFRHWRDGVWMLNPQEDDIHAVLLDLLDARAALTSASTCSPTLST